MIGARQKHEPRNPARCLLWALANFFMAPKRARPTVRTSPSVTQTTGSLISASTLNRTLPAPRPRGAPSRPRAETPSPACTAPHCRPRGNEQGRQGRRRPPASAQMSPPPHPGRVSLHPLRRQTLRTRQHQQHCRRPTCAGKEASRRRSEGAASLRAARRPTVRPLPQAQALAKVQRRRQAQEGRQAAGQGKGLRWVQP